MRFFVVILALTGFVFSTGCTNTAQGFGKDLEKSGQAIQKSVGKTSQSNTSGNNANAQPAQAPASGSYNAYGSDQSYTPTPTPSGY